MLGPSSDPQEGDGREAQVRVEAMAFDTLPLRVTSSLVLGEQGGEVVDDVSTCLGQVVLFHCWSPATLMPREICLCGLPIAVPGSEPPSPLEHEFHGGRTFGSFVHRHIRRACPVVSAQSIPG